MWAVHASHDWPVVARSPSISLNIGNKGSKKQGKALKIPVKSRSIEEANEQVKNLETQEEEQRVDNCDENISEPETPRVNKGKETYGYFPDVRVDEEEMADTTGPLHHAGGSEEAWWSEKRSMRRSGGWRSGSARGRNGMEEESE
uniref:Uncharacterized protein n=1 Tax=Timema cristinae TaxID=61476 RepID=A0A7R9DA10_TIMCR|nr:unnamed protein product [Timema cristinae]